MMSLLGQGVLTVVGNPGILLAMFVGVFIGIIFGALPGLTTVACLSMFLPVTYVMSQEMGLSMLTAIYIGGMSGGLVSAILLNIPGTPSSIATCFDGTPMAKKGLAGKALGTGVFASIVGNFIGVLAMIFISPPLAAATLQFGPWENFGVTLFALTLIASLCGKNIYTGLLSAVFGMMFSTIGLDKIDSSQRFTFGFNSLTTGFGLLTVLVGMYAVSEVLKTASSDQQEGKVNEDFHMHGLGLTGTEIKSQSWNLLRSSLIGLAIGILPGIGGSTANIIAYSVAKSSSKYPEKFGTGIIDGICASESANNASVGGAMIPLLTLGIPGDGSTALLLGGFMLHGLQPGPLLFQNNGSIVYSIFASMLISTVMMGVTNIPMLNADIVTGISFMLLFLTLKVPFGFVTILLAHITFNIPYVIVSVMPRYRELNPHIYEAALDLGASPATAFRKTVLPELMPSILSGGLMAFTMSLDDFIITHFTAGAGIHTLSTKIYSEVKLGIKPEMYALSAMIFVTVFVLLLLVNRAQDSAEKARIEDR